MEAVVEKKKKAKIQEDDCKAKEKAENEAKDKAGDRDLILLNTARLRNTNAL